MILLLSIVMRVVALVVSIALLRRIRDWRMAFLTAMLALMATRQALTLSRLVNAGKWSLSPDSISFDELPGLLVSVLAGLAVVFLGKMLREQRATFDELRSKEAMVLQGQKMDALGHLAGRTAHDFNNLLTIIIGNADYAKSQLPEGHVAQEPLAELEQAAHRGADLSRKILAFSRKQVVEPRVVDVNEMLLGLDGMLRPLLGSDVEFVVLAAATRPLVHVDPGQLETALVNLAVNARDAMPDGGKLTITTENEPESPITDGNTPQNSGPSVVITVSDTGTGMTRSAVEQAFEPFFTTKPEDQGTGLGLSICHGVFKRAGGSIEIDYSSPEGTSFRATLPQLSDAEPWSDQPATPAGSVRGDERILVVEDEHQLRKLETRALRAQGYQVLEAANGAEAMRILEGSTPHIALVVTDVVMPLMGGIELAQNLRKLDPELPILFTSGYLPEANMPSLGRIGRTNFLQKPYNPNEFVAKVREILDVRQPADSAASKT